MTINNLEKFMESLPDWAMLAGCFGDTTIAPTDVDGLVERGGKCLFLEHKGQDAYLSDGQARTFRALALQGNTILTFWGTGNDVEKIRIDVADGTKMIQPGTLDDLRELVSKWFIESSKKC